MLCYNGYGDTMWMFIIMLIVGIIGIASSYFPPGLSALALYGLLFGGFFLAVISFILFILMMVEKKKWLWYLLTIFLYVIYVFLLPDVYHYLRGNFLVKEHLKEFDVSGKVIGVDKKDYKFGDNGYDSCSYTFNVKLDDGENVVFQSGYCEVGTMWTDYATVDNFGHHYIPHLFNKYKKEHSTSLTLDVNEEDFSAEPCALHYSGSRYGGRSDELCDFLKYLDENSHGADFSLELVGDDENDFEVVHSWNHFDIEYNCKNGVDY